LGAWLRRRPVTGSSDVFDLHIVAAMQANGMGRIYAFNIADFEAVHGIRPASHNNPAG
jgi:hypothetical protein